MEKLIERLVELLPIPVVIACAAVVILGYSIKELRDLPSEGAVARDPWFQVCAVIALAATVVYYASVAILSHSSPKRFSDKERGIVVSPLSGDKNGDVQKHTLASLKEELSRAENLNDVVVIATSSAVETTVDANEVIERTKARAVVWGSFLPPEVVHYTITTSKGETHVPSYNFKDVTVLTSKVVQFLQLTPPPAGSNTDDQVAFYKRKIDELEKQNESLITQTGHDKTSLPLASATVPQVTLVPIGVSNYQNIPRLRFSAADAQAISHVFRQIPRESITTLIDPTRNSMLEALLRPKQQTDTLIFYFSGASATDDNDTFLLPVDAKPDSLPATAIPLREAVDALQRLHAKHTVIFLDGVSSAEYSHRTNIRPTEIPQDTAIFMAASPGQSAVESVALNHGLFTYYLLKGLSGEGNASQNGLVTSDRLFQYVEASVRRASAEIGFPQLPYYASNSELDIPLIAVPTSSIVSTEK